MNHISGIDRDQIQMLCIDQMVAPKSMVRVIDAFVDMLDLKTFDFSYFKLNKEGRPPFHPAVFLKMYLYGYQNEIRSSRKLQKACTINLEMIWLTKGRTPHYKTIANFRKDNHKAFKSVFRHFVALLKDWNLVDGKTIGIDSFKSRAQNSLKNNFNDRKINKHLAYIDAKIQEYEAKLEQEDSPEIKQKINKQKNKKAHYIKAKELLKDSGQEQVSITDPDARAMVFSRNSVRIGYNVQAVSDAKNKLLIAANTGDVNDSKALADMTKRAIKNIGSVENVLADKGYHSGREIKATQELGVNTFISPKESSSSKKNLKYAMESFTYNEMDDSYTCPANQTMDTNGKSYFKKLKNTRASYHVKHYKTKACKTCSIRNLCTSNKVGRIIERTEYAQYVQQNNNRVNENPEYYRIRQQIIEHQFGTLKRHWGFDYLLTKGKQKVMGEVYIAFTVYNLKRISSIFNFDTLMDKLKSIKHYVSLVLMALFHLKTPVLSHCNFFWNILLFNKNKSIISI